MDSFADRSVWRRPVVVAAVLLVVALVVAGGVVAARSTASDVANTVQLRAETHHGERVPGGFRLYYNVSTTSPGTVELTALDAALPGTVVTSVNAQGLRAAPRAHWRQPATITSTDPAYVWVDYRIVAPNCHPTAGSTLTTWVSYQGHASGALHVTVDDQMATYLFEQASNC